MSPISLSFTISIKFHWFILQFLFGWVKNTPFRCMFCLFSISFSPSFFKCSVDFCAETLRLDSFKSYHFQIFINMFLFVSWTDSSDGIQIQTKKFSKYNDLFLSIFIKCTLVPLTRFDRFNKNATMKCLVPSFFVCLSLFVSAPSKFE